MSTGPSLDPVSVAAAVIAAIVGPKLAPVVGAYTVILFAWMGGVLVGLYRRDPASRMSTAMFVCVTFVLTVGGAAFAADQLSKQLAIDSTSLLFPASFLIPAIGHSWFDLAKWAWGLFSARFPKGQ